MRTVFAAMNTTSSKQYSATYPWFIWSLGASFYFLHYIYRVSGSVIVPELMHEFGVGAVVIGTLSSFFYYSYVGMQMPVGILLDRFSTRYLMSAMTLLCAIGCFLFANAYRLPQVEIARFLIGFGAAFAFIGTMKLVTQWFPASRVGLLAGATQALGMAGASMGEKPMAMLNQMFQWRQVNTGIAVLFIALSILMFLFIRDKKNQTKPSNKTPVSESLAIVLRNPQTWINGMLIGMLYAPMTCFSELWGVSFFKQSYALNTETAANIIGLIFIGWAAGGPIVGWLSDYLQRRKLLIIISTFICLLLMSALLYLPGLSLLQLNILAFLFGVSNTGVGVSYAVATEINPRSVVGTSIAFANMMTVIIGAILQPIIGVLLDAFWDGKMIDDVPYYSAHDFKLVMLMMPIVLVIALTFSFFLKETYCQPVAETA